MILRFVYYENLYLFELTRNLANNQIAINKKYNSNVCFPFTFRFETKQYDWASIANRDDESDDGNKMFNTLT